MSLRRGLGPALALQGLLLRDVDACLGQGMQLQKPDPRPRVLPGAGN